MTMSCNQCPVGTRDSSTAELLKVHWEGRSDLSPWRHHSEPMLQAMHFDEGITNVCVWSAVEHVETGKAMNHRQWVSLHHLRRRVPQRSFVEGTYDNSSRYDFPYRYLLITI